MSVKRNAKGRFVKGTSSPRAKASPNKPRKRRAVPKRRAAPKRRRSPARRTPAAMARSVVNCNPPTPVLTETLSATGAAVFGGLVGVAALAMSNQVVTDPTARAVASVVVPGIVAAVATQASHRHAQAFAAGAAGVAGAGLARAVSSAVLARANPPASWDWNPPPGIAPRLVPGALPSAWSSPIKALARAS